MVGEERGGVVEVEGGGRRRSPLGGVGWVVGQAEREREQEVGGAGGEGVGGCGGRIEKMEYWDPLDTNIQCHSSQQGEE